MPSQTLLPASHSTRLIPSSSIYPQRCLSAPAGAQAPMSSPQADEDAQRPESQQRPPDTIVHWRHPIDENQVTDYECRQIVRLVQCPGCSFPLRDPYTLPCGRTICKRCLPEKHQRSNISFVTAADRLHGLWCPFPECGKEHPFSDCSPDVALARLVSVVLTELDKGLEEAVGSGMSTRVTITKPFELEDGSTKEVESETVPVKGNRLAAVYQLAKAGKLSQREHTYFPDSTTKDGEAMDTQVVAGLKEMGRAEMDCQICYALFFDPVTTPCGHTFCRTCLQRVLDHARYCPVCRRAMTIQPILRREFSPSNEILRVAITYFWADMIEERKQTIIAESLNDGSRDWDLAIFVCTLSFPCMPTFLHVFEPRYRLMIRRALEGDRTFGMVLYDGNRFRPLGTILRIVNVQFFPDGRSLIETVGTSRFEILDHGNLDGYVVAKIQKIDDISTAEEEELEISETRRRRPGGDAAPGTDTNRGTTSESPPNRTRFPTTVEEIREIPTSDLMEFGVDFVRRMREQSVDWLKASLFSIYGECPSDPAIFPWWFANILPLNETEKYRLLSTTSVRERLKICCRWILEWERNTW